jgi:hypothetical protein
MIVQWNVSTGEYIATLPGYPGDRPWGSACNAAANATELEAIDITSGWPVSEQPK